MSLDKRLTEIFATFQNKDTNVVDVTEIPTIIRALGLVPSESEMKKTVSAMVGEESENTVHLGAFLTITKKLIMDRRFLPSSNLELQTALGVIATEGKKILEMEEAEQTPVGGVPTYGESTKKFYPRGSLTRTDFIRLLTKEGEALSQDEADELMVTLPLQDEECVNIEVYSSQLIPTAHFF